MLTAILALAITLPAASPSQVPALPTNTQTAEKQNTRISSHYFSASKPLTFGAFDSAIRQASVYVSNQSASNALVQQKVGSKWVTVKRVGKDASESPAAVAILGPAATARAGVRGKAGTSGQYRLYVPETDSTKAATTPTLNVSWSKPLRQSANLPFGTAKRVDARNSNWVNGTVYVPTGSRGVTLERKIGNAWKPVKTVHSTWNGGKPVAKFTVTAPPNNTTHAYRIKLPQTTTHAAWTSSEQQLFKGKIDSSLQYWSTKNHRLPTNVKTTFNGYTTGKTRTYRVQQLSKGKWKTVSTGRTGSNGKFKASTPNTQATTKATYRVHLPATKTHTAATTPTMNVQHINPRHYTGYRRTIYNHIKKWCPNIIINTAAPNAAYSGKAQLGGHEITLVNGMSGNRLKHVALHECAHNKQGRVFMDNNKLYDRMAKIYKKSRSQSLEYAADCMARAMGSPGPYSYNKSCSGYRGSAAKLMLAGKKP